MSQHSDAEFEQLIHSDETHIEQLESDDSRELRAGLEPTQPVAIDNGELPV